MHSNSLQTERISEKQCLSSWSLCYFNEVTNISIENVGSNLNINLMVSSTYVILMSVPIFTLDMQNEIFLGVLRRCNSFIGLCNFKELQYLSWIYAGSNLMVGVVKM